MIGRLLPLCKRPKCTVGMCSFEKGNEEIVWLLIAFLCEIVQKNQTDIIHLY